MHHQKAWIRGVFGRMPYRNGWVGRGFVTDRSGRLIPVVMIAAHEDGWGIRQTVLWNEANRYMGGEACHILRHRTR